MDFGCGFHDKLRLRHALEHAAGGLGFLFEFREQYIDHLHDVLLFLRAIRRRA